MDLLVAARRRHPELNAALASLAETDARTMRLDPLDAEAVAQVVAEVLGGGPDPPLLEFAARAHGSPFLLMELLLGLLEEDAVEIAGGSAQLVSDRLPAWVSQSMQARLERLSPFARHAATIAPALGQEFRFDDLTAMLDAEPADLLAAVSELIESDLLVGHGERLAFRHDLLREAAIGSLPPGAWRSLQRQAAKVMLVRGAPAIEVAASLIASAAPGDEEAIEALYAAVQALGPSDPAAAADLSRRTLELTTTGHPLRARLVAETALLLHGGTGRGGRPLRQRRAASDSPGRAGGGRPPLDRRHVLRLPRHPSAGRQGGARPARAFG